MILRNTIFVSISIGHFVAHLQASMASVNLSAHAYWTPDPTFTSYLNYGAGISEVSKLHEKHSKRSYQAKLLEAAPLVVLNADR
jgi:hypothetical protein